MIDVRLSIGVEDSALEMFPLEIRIFLAVDSGPLIGSFERDLHSLRCHHDTAYL
jgi:hypothetical protein